MPDTLVHYRWSDLPGEAVNPFVTRRFITAARSTVARFQLKRGGTVPSHAHEQEQITCVLSGALKFIVEGQELVVRAGEVVQIPAWLEHGVEVVEDADVIDVFSPIRQDWIEKTDDYFRR